MVKNKGRTCSLNKVTSILNNEGCSRLSKGPSCNLTEAHKLKRIPLGPIRNYSSAVCTGLYNFTSPQKMAQENCARNQRWYGVEGVMAWLGISVNHGLFLHVFEPRWVHIVFLKSVPLPPLTPPLTSPHLATPCVAK